MISRMRTVGSARAAIDANFWRFDLLSRRYITRWVAISRPASTAFPRAALVRSVRNQWAAA